MNTSRKTGSRPKPTGVVDGAGDGLIASQHTTATAQKHGRPEVAREPATDVAVWTAVVGAVLPNTGNTRIQAPRA
jgi:hypothetical protein